MLTAVILAGSRPGIDPVAASEHVHCKALVRIGRATMLEHVIDALEAAGIERIAVISESEAVAQIATERGVAWLAAGQGPSDSALKALETLGSPLLVTTVDHPLLQPQWVRQFLADAPASADAVAMLARREDVEAAIPGSRRTWLRFSDGHWSGCNLFLLRTPRAAGALRFWQQVEKNRKRPWRIAGAIGPGTLARYLLGRLPRAEAFTSLGRTMGSEVAAVTASSGLAAVDVDTVADLRLVRSILEGQVADDSPPLAPGHSLRLEPALSADGAVPVHRKG
jgi:GTP:adenosylcobinamide-phosphate guanylyltransferase